MEQNIKKQHGVFEVTQNIFLINGDGNLLLLQHNTGKWLLVGGHLNIEERWEQGLRREVKEETGITKFSIEGILDFDNWEYKKVPHCGIFFFGRIKNNENIKLSREHINYKWVKSEREIKKLEFWVPELQKRVINNFRKIKEMEEKTKKADMLSGPKKMKKMFE